MPETNFRALCEELMDEAIYLGAIPYNQAPNPELIARTRAALAQPEPVAPTDEELEDLAEVMNVSGNPVPAMRRALDLWGRQ
jgi:hypothetical protein